MVSIEDALIACQTYLYFQNQDSPVGIELTASSSINPMISSAPSPQAPTMMHIHAEFLSTQRAKTVDAHMLPSNTASVGIENPFTQGAPATQVG